MSTTGSDILCSLINSAAARGDSLGNDAHIEALESLLIAAWSLMTFDQKAAVLASDAGGNLQ